MSEKQKKFLELVNRMMPRMSELEQEKMLAFGEGMAFMYGVSSFDHRPERRTARERAGA